MADNYLKFVNSSIGKTLAKQLGLPQPVELRRYVEGAPCFEGVAMIGSARGSVFGDPIQRLLRRESASTVSIESGHPAQQLKTVFYDASGITQSGDTTQLVDFFSPILRSLSHGARVVVIGLIPERCPPSHHVAQRSLLGFVKSLAKEMRNGGTVNLVWAHPDCDRSLEAPLTFFGSDRSAYVSGQFLEVYPASVGETQFVQPIAGKNVLVTGAARGIGKAIALLVRQRGASVTCLDVPQAESDLRVAASEVDGAWLSMDITAADAGERIADHFANKPLHGIVHNAGITRDKKLANMNPEMWDAVLQTNLSCQERINEFLIANDAIRSGGRIVSVSSISGIGGNAGQTNYATSKAGVIGMVGAYARDYFERGITINAVAPGFIETKMVETIPLALRQFGRRLNSMAQGGLPQDVAEAVALFLQDDSSGLYGNVLRVCGQAILGA